MATTEPQSPFGGDLRASTGSHPVIRFEQVPIVQGPLWQLDRIRPDILEEVIRRTEADFASKNLDFVLGEALYSERWRLSREAKARLDLPFILHRHLTDKRLWRNIHGGLLKGPAESDRRQMLHAVVRHYAGEIGGHFHPNIYWLATRAVPWGFSWLLNAASVSRFLPWGMSESLVSRLRILGEVPWLQKLARQGTILLMPTHQSNIDSLLVGYVIYLMSLPPFSYGAGLNLFTNPVFSFFMSNLGAYTVDRQKTNEVYKETLKNYSTATLRRGIHSIFFPGGGRSRSGAIESHLKLGLLGTGLQAQIENLKEGKHNPKVFVVPMVMSYHFVPEALSLIESYLETRGKHRFMGADAEAPPALMKIVNFFWKFFSSQSTMTVRIGKPLDIFGNFVDEEGRSIGPNGTTVDPTRWLTTKGEIRPEPQRDAEYVRQLGRVLVERFHRENTVLSSHLVAFSLFHAIRKKYPDLDLYRFLRLSAAQRSLPLDAFLKDADVVYRTVRAAADQGKVYMSTELMRSGNETRAWVDRGIGKLGLLHDSAVVRIHEGAVTTDDMNLLYYYRNRLAGYGISLMGDKGFTRIAPGEHDEKGFLA